MYDSAEMLTEAIRTDRNDADEMLSPARLRILDGRQYGLSEDESEAIRVTLAARYVAVAERLSAVRLKRAKRISGVTSWDIESEFTVRGWVDSWRKHRDHRYAEEAERRRAKREAIKARQQATQADGRTTEGTDAETHAATQEVTNG